MAGAGRMQMLVTRFERLTRRISLAGIASGHKASEAIAQGRVLVDGKVAASNFKVFNEAVVTLDGIQVPAPLPEPKLWAMFKPRKVLCEAVEEKEGTETLRSRMRAWYDREYRQTGAAASTGLDDESLMDKHWVIACGLPYMADGLVLLTNDGLFAEALESEESNILSAFDVKVHGDPPVDLLHSWRRGARACGVNFGRVFASITKRNGATTRMRIKLVESPDRPIDMLLDGAKMRVQQVRRYAFGPYTVTDLPSDRVVRVPIHKSIRHLIPVADMQQALVPARGSLLQEDGSLRRAGLQNSAVLSNSEYYPDEQESSDGIPEDRKGKQRWARGNLKRFSKDLRSART